MTCLLALTFLPVFFKQRGSSLVINLCLLASATLMELRLHILSPLTVVGGFLCKSPGPCHLVSCPPPSSSHQLSRQVWQRRDLLRESEKEEGPERQDLWPCLPALLRAVVISHSCFCLLVGWPPNVLSKPIFVHVLADLILQTVPPTGR